MQYFCLKLIQHHGYLVSTMDTDGLVFEHQGISNHSAEYTPLYFQPFMS